MNNEDGFIQMKFIIVFLLSVVAFNINAKEKGFTGVCSEGRELTGKILNDFDNAASCNNDDSFSREFKRVQDYYPTYTASELHKIVKENEFTLQKYIKAKAYFLVVKVKKIEKTQIGEKYVVYNGDRNPYADSFVFTASQDFDLTFGKTFFGRLMKNSRENDLPTIGKGDVLTFICPSTTPKSVGSLSEKYTGCFYFSKN
ncbi:hypothetical protein ACV90N_001737 [Klebsiella pneumoniae]|nr:hypothetical protein [Klebsiella pneumoniae]ELA0171861.1 hypothetical protein [Klebsiella pneumoniae]ELA2226730.1 hypothetical protein [Klebsiella pneumoniae]